MAMEFRSYRDADGYMRDPSLLMDGPIAPGTLIIKVPVVATINLRVGVIVAVHDGQVDVMWQPWTEDRSIADGQLRKRMGIPNARERKRLKWELKKQQRVQLTPTP